MIHGAVARVPSRDELSCYCTARTLIDAMLLYREEHPLT